MKVLLLAEPELLPELTVQLRHEGHLVTVLVSPEHEAECISSVEGVRIVLAHGALSQALKSAGVESADAVLAFTYNDTYNAMTVQIAKHIHGVPKTLCLVKHPARSQAFKQLNLNVVSPSELMLQATRKTLAS